MLKAKSNELGQGERKEREGGGREERGEEGEEGGREESRKRERRKGNKGESEQQIQYFEASIHTH